VSFETYSTRESTIQGVFEVIFCFMLLLGAVSEFTEALSVRKRTGSYLNYFKDFWSSFSRFLSSRRSYIDWLSIGCMAAAVALYIILISTFRSQNLQSEYQILINPRADARWFVTNVDKESRLNDDMDGLGQVMGAVQVLGIEAGSDDVRAT
jgi:hypothetical protein